MEARAAVLTPVPEEANGSSLPEYDALDVARHSTSSSCWVVVDGLVYDVSTFNHPGPDLHDRGGTDVSHPFRVANHPPEALRALPRLLVGRFVERGAPTPAAAVGLTLEPEALSNSETAALERSERRALDTNERRALKAGSIHGKARAGEALWSTRRRGFLPARDPIKRLSGPYIVLHELVARLPTALAEGTFRALVDAAAARFEPLVAAIADETSIDVLERVKGLYGYIGKGYVHGVVGADGAYSVPAFLAAGWLAVSKRVGRHPTIDYADCVLYNWERVQEGAALTPENIRLLNRFTGLLDEEWFLKTHVIIESEAAGVVSAIHEAHHAVLDNDCDRLLATLSRMEQSMSHVASNCLWIMFERSEEEGFLCEPDFFFHRFRPYISTWTALFEGQYESTERLAELQEELAMVSKLAESSTSLPDLTEHKRHLTDSIHALQARKRLAGPSGAMSTLLPLCDAFCDIQMSSAELGRMLATFEEYMPTDHREMLTMVRQCTARQYILQLARRGDAQAASLVDHFNAFVRRVLDFRWRHLSYIEQYVLKPSGESSARGTGGTPAFAYLNQHIADTEAALIKGRFWGRLSHDEEVVTYEEEAPDDNVLSPDLNALTIAFHGGKLSLNGDGVEGEPPPLPPLWAVSVKHGLLPSRPPIDLNAMPPSWRPVIELAMAVPRECVPPPTFRSHVMATLHELPTDCDALVDENTRERGRCLLAFIIAGWHAASIEPTTPRASMRDPPVPLRRLFDRISALVHRAPRFGLVDLILYNWRWTTPTLTIKEGDLDESADDDVSSATDSNRERGWSHDTTGYESAAAAAGGVTLGVPPYGRPGLGSMSTVSPMVRFLCVDEEDWFCRLHVTLAGDAALEMAAIRKCFAAKTTDQQVRGLQQLEAALEVLVRVHYTAGIGQPIGSDVPKCRSIREQVERVVRARSLAVNDLSRLELAYNSCIDMLLRFFARRNELVRQMFGADILKEAFDLERSAILGARLRLLGERRENSVHGGAQYAAREPEPLETIRREREGAAS